MGDSGSLQQAEGLSSRALEEIIVFVARGCLAGREDGKVGSSGFCTPKGLGDGGGGKTTLTLGPDITNQHASF